MFWQKTSSILGSKITGVKLAAIGLAAGGAVAISSPAKADGFRFGINIGVPIFRAAPVYYAPAPVYYSPAPQPVYAPQYVPAPQPVYSQPVYSPPVYCPPPARVYYQPRPLVVFHTGWNWGDRDGWHGRAQWRGGDRDGGRFQRFGGWHRGGERH